MEPCSSRHKAPRDTATTAKHPPVARMKTHTSSCSFFFFFFFFFKWPSGSLRRSYLGQGADANVGQKEPLLSIKKKREKGGVIEEDRESVSPR